MSTFTTAQLCPPGDAEGEARGEGEREGGGDREREGYETEEEEPPKRFLLSVKLLNFVNLQFHTPTNSIS